jgi:hypothetical protein
VLNQLKDALKALNKRNATTEELKEAEGFISDAAEAVGDLSRQWKIETPNHNPASAWPNANYQWAITRSLSLAQRHHGAGF